MVLLELVRWTKVLLDDLVDRLVLVSDAIANTDSIQCSMYYSYLDLFVYSHVAELSWLS